MWEWNPYYLIVEILSSIIDTAGYVKVWHYPTQQCVYTFDEKDRQPLTLDFNCNYSRLYVAGKLSTKKELNSNNRSFLFYLIFR